MRPERLVRRSEDVPAILLTLTAAAGQTMLFALVEQPHWLILGALVLHPALIISNAVLHNHSHVSTFRSALLNRLYDVLLFLQSGQSNLPWAIAHNLGHHKNYRDQDYESTTHDEYHWLTRDGRIMGRLGYTLKTIALAYSYLWRNGPDHPKLFRQAKAQLAAHLILLAALIAIRPVAGIIVFLVPMLLSVFHMAWWSYVHHVGLISEDPLAASYSNLDRLANILTFNTGYHTVHHYRPGVHWADLPALHEELAAKIPAHCIHDGSVPEAVVQVLRARQRMPEDGVV